MGRKARRGRGEGGIRYREDKGLWVGELRLHGKRYTVYGTTKRQCQEKMKDRERKAESGLSADADQYTLGAWLTRWLANIEPTVEPKTYAPYEQHVRLHITPHIGTIKLVKLRRAHVRGLYATLASSGMSAPMQRKVGTTLTIALNAAVEDELLIGNPAARIKKPKAPKADIEVLTPEEVAKLLEAASEDRLSAFYRTALDSGCRPGELFALRWPDVDFEGGFLTISKALEEIGGSLRVKVPKTKKSRRRVDLSTDTLAALAEHRKAMLAAGFIDSPVFCDTEGGFLRIQNLYRDSWHPLLKRGGLRQMGLYSLWHTCATLLLLADVSPKVVSERLGHSTITLTLDTYSHVLPTMQKRAADAIGKLLGSKPEAKRV
jgi:integrase